jgi:antitoxin VapB
MTKAVKKNDEVRAKLFTNGRSQAVRLPKEFRFEGKEVKVRRVLGGVLLEPIALEDKPVKTMEELFARMDALRGDPIFPEGREQPEPQERDWSLFDTRG